MDIQKFRLEDIKPYSTILIIGPRNSGKTTLMKDLLSSIKAKIGTYFSPCPSPLKDCFSESSVYTYYDSSVVKKIIKCASTTSRFVLSGDLESQVVCFEDSDSLIKDMMDKLEIHNLYHFPYHLKMYVINSVQSPTSITPIRASFDYIFVFRNNIHQRQIYDKFFSADISSFEQFSLTLEKYTEDQNCLVIDTTSLSNKLEDCLKFYKAKQDIPPFVFAENEQANEAREHFSMYKVTNVATNNSLLDEKTSNPTLIKTNAETKQIVLRNKTINIERFSLHNLKPYGNILIIGPRGTGKTLLVKDILSSTKAKMGTYITPCSGQLRDCFAESSIYNSIDLNVIAKLIEQENGVNKNEIESQVVCFDDTNMFETIDMKTTQMRDLYQNGRHIKTWIINSLQYPMRNMSPDLRIQIDYVFVFRNSNLSQRQQMYNQFFAGAVNTFQDFSVILENCTNDYHCLVLDKSLSSSLSCFKFYKANQDIPPFVFAENKVANQAREIPRKTLGREESYTQTENIEPNLSLLNQDPISELTSRQTEIQHPEHVSCWSIIEISCQEVVVEEETATA
jgi:Cdc6-like AAA superfamily ATPase